MVIKITNIKYDTDGDKKVLETLPKWMFCTSIDSDHSEDELEELVGDYISKKTGYCHKGFKYEVINEHYNTIKVETKEQLNELYNSSALTFVGIEFTDNNICQILTWIKMYSELKKNPMDIYFIFGKTMNEKYQLKGDKRFQDDLNIVSIKLTDIKEPTSLCIPRFEVGAKWFDDIVDNSTEQV